MCFSLNYRVATNTTILTLNKLLRKGKVENRTCLACPVESEDIFHLWVKSCQIDMIHTTQKLRNKSWKPECVLDFNVSWRILVIWLGMKFTNICQPMLKLKTNSGFHFDSDMSKSTHTVVLFDWKTVMYIYACGQCRTQIMLLYSSRRQLINM